MRWGSFKNIFTLPERPRSSGRALNPIRIRHDDASSHMLNLCFPSAEDLQFVAIPVDINMLYTRPLDMGFSNHVS